MPKNKIKFGLKNVHYAKATIADDGSATYDAPVRIPGAVTLSMEAQGENTPFYADDVVYYVAASNNGYEGDLELALVPDEFKKDILGYIEDAKSVLIEDGGAEAVHFALLFQFAGDVKAKKHIMYNCTATRPATSSGTKAETVEPQTETLSLAASTIYVEALDKDIVKAESTESTDATTYSNWYQSVYMPTANSGT